MKKMKRKHVRAGALLLLCVFLMIGILPAVARETRDAGAIVDGILAGQLSRTDAGTTAEFLNGWATENAGGMADWYVMALYHTAGLPTGETARYGGALLSHIRENDGKIPAATRQRYALSLIAAGIRADSFLSGIVDQTVDDGQIMTLIFGIHLLRAGCPSEHYTETGLADALLAMRLSDGGWAISGGTGDADVTAMTLGVLAPLREERFVTASEEAIAFLSERQLPDGGYESWGMKNAESCAQVILGLRAAGVDVQNDARFIKNEKSVFDALMAYRLADGSFSHAAGGAADGMATVQALAAAIALSKTPTEPFDFYAFRSETLTDPIYPAAPTEPESDPALTTRLIATAALVFLALVAAICLFVRKRANKKAWVVLTVALLALLALVWGTNLLTGSGENFDQIPESERVGRVVISVRCDAITAEGRELPDGIPADGVLLSPTSVDIRADETVYQVLEVACRRAGLTLDASGIVLGNSGAAYIRGIAGLSEFDFGATSGWVYTVNGESPAMSCGSCRLSDGDVIEFAYTLEFK